MKYIYLIVLTWSVLFANENLQSIYDNIVLKNSCDTVLIAKELKQSIKSKKFKQSKKEFHALVLAWKKVEGFYLLSGLNAKYRELSTSIKHIEIENNLTKELDTILSSKTKLKEALASKNYNTLDAIEYVLFSKNIKKSRVYKALKIMTATLVKNLDAIYDGYLAEEKHFVKDKSASDSMIETVLNKSEYKIKEKLEDNASYDALDFVLLKKMQTRTQVLMATLVSVTLPMEEDTLFSRVFTLIKEIEGSLSSYDTEALVYRLNHSHSVVYDKYLKEALILSRAYYMQTKGYFDITVGALSKNLYHFGEENETIPSKISLELAYLNIQAITLNESNISIEENITMDLGGMGKGYTVDKVVSLLKEANISKAVVALSGDIACIGSCNIALQSPFSEQTFASIKSITPRLSISTSGTYRRYIKDKSHHHLFNPKTNRQGKAFVSVSLFSSANNSTLDAYATAIAVMPKDEAYLFLKRQPNIGFVLVEAEGDIVYGNLKNLVELEWKYYKENATSPNKKMKTKTKKKSETILIHPDTTNPKEIKK